jgi:DNA-binding XRE family transcriptional regulator
MKEIPLSQGLVALVDDEDYEWLNQWKWSAAITHCSGRETKYAVCSRGIMHRLIIDAPSGVGTKHINHNTLDNQRDNLCLATPPQIIINSTHRRMQIAANSSRYKSGKFRGVHFQAGKYYYATMGDREGYLGSFHTPEGAALAYNRKAVELWGDAAMLNPVTEIDVERAEQTYAEVKKEIQERRLQDDVALCAQLRAFRQARGWRQKDLADALKVSYNYMSGLETGKLHPGRKLAQAIRGLLFPSEGDTIEVVAGLGLLP